MVWKTYLVMYFGTTSKKPTEVVKLIEELGFETNFGPVDFTYSWEKQPSKEEVLLLSDKVSEVLRGSGAVFNLDTHN